VSESKGGELEEWRKDQMKEVPDGRPFLKWCPRCREERPIGEFGKNRLMADGLAYYCRVHQNAICRASQAKYSYVGVRTGGKARP